MNICRGTNVAAHCEQRRAHGIAWNETTDAMVRT